MILVPVVSFRILKRTWLAGKRGRDQQEKAEWELRMALVKYAFSQEVILYHREPGEVRTEANGTGGWTVSPHWRRGHWRSQPCGLGRTERRRIAIPSVLVNGHLFVGSPADTMATYRV